MRRRIFQLLLYMAKQSDGLITSLTDKVNRWSGTDSGNTYVTVDSLAYDSTNKTLGLKVNGADTVIPFSGSGALKISTQQSTVSASSPRVINFTLGKIFSVFYFMGVSGDPFASYSGYRDINGNTYGARPPEINGNQITIRSGYSASWSILVIIQYT